MARLTDDQRDLILADFHIGKSQNELAKKYKVSPATINKICKGIQPKHVDKVNTLTRIQTELAGESECQINAIHFEVDERTKHLNFFNNASLTIAKRAVDRVQEDDGMSMADMRHASEIVAKQREGVLGKSPEVAVQINNTVQTIRPRN